MAIGQNQSNNREVRPGLRDTGGLVAFDLHILPLPLVVPLEPVPQTSGWLGELA